MDYDEDKYLDESSLENDELFDELDNSEISEEIDNAGTNNGNSFSYNQNMYNSFDYNHNDINSIRKRINNRQMINNNNINTNTGVNNNKNNSLEKKPGLPEKQSLNEKNNLENSKSNQKDLKQEAVKKVAGKAAEAYGGKAAGAAAEKIMDSEIGKKIIEKSSKKFKKTIIFKLIGGVLSFLVPIIIFGAAIAFIVSFPLILLGIDVGGSETDSNVTEKNSYSEVEGGKYLWPIGSDKTTEKDGVTYALDKPHSTVITSNYGKREDPINQGTVRTHKGVDIGNVSAGKTNVIAANSGVVVKVVDNCISYDKKHQNCGGGYGNHILISHSDGKYTLYAHLHQNSITVKKNDKVSAGQVIAKTGSSGRSTGAHLHFEVRTNSSSRTNPLNYVNKKEPRFATQYES